MIFAGFWRRLLAYFIDVIPITLAVAAVFYFFFGFDTTLTRYLNRNRDDVEARAAFLGQRNLIRETSLILYLLYAAIAESSVLQGTLGKRLLGIVVTNRDGQKLRFGTALTRNILKVLSFLPCGLGCLWILWSPEKRAWHDHLAGTLVVFREGRQPNVSDIS